MRRVCVISARFLERMRVLMKAFMEESPVMAWGCFVSILTALAVLTRACCSRKEKKEAAVPTPAPAPDSAAAASASDADSAPAAAVEGDASGEGKKKK